MLLLLGQLLVGKPSPEFLHRVQHVGGEITCIIRKDIIILIGPGEVREGDPLTKGEPVDLHIAVLDGIAENERQRIGGDDDRDVLPSFLRMLMLCLADVALSLKEELGIIPAVLVPEECCGSSLVDGDELGGLLDLIIIEIETGPSLGVIDHIEDLAVHLELRGLTTIADSPFPDGAALAFCLQECVFDEIVDGFLVARLQDSV